MQSHGAGQRQVDEVFGDEPDLQFICSDDIPDDRIISTVAIERASFNTTRAREAGARSPVACMANPDATAIR